MKVDEAILSFTDWSEPWRFPAHVREVLNGWPAELAVFEAMAKVAYDPAVWRLADLPFACKIAHTEVKQRFPAVAEGAIALLVRAASYEGR